MKADQFCDQHFFVRLVFVIFETWKDFCVNTHLFHAASTMTGPQQNFVAQCMSY